MRVPAGQQLTVQAHNQTGLNPDPIVRLLAGCGATTCLATSNISGPYDTEPLQYTNTTGSDQELIVAVSNAVDGQWYFQVRFVVEAPWYAQSSIAASCVSRPA